MSGVKTFGFGFRALKKFPELWPLAVCIGGACGLATGYSAYALSTKSDVVIRKGSQHPWEKVDPEKKQKLYTINTKYQKIPMLEALREEIKESS